MFTTLELLLDDSNGKRKGNPSSGPTFEEVEQAVVRIITDNQNNGKATGLGEVGSRLLKRFPDFDVRSYGTNLLSKLLSKFDSVTITKSGSDVSVELADDKDIPKKKDASRAEADKKAKDRESDATSTANATEEATVSSEESAKTPASRKQGRIAANAAEVRVAGTTRAASAMQRRSRPKPTLQCQRHQLNFPPTPPLLLLPLRLKPR